MNLTIAAFLFAIAIGVGAYALWSGLGSGRDPASSRLRHIRESHERAKGLLYGEKPAWPLEFLAWLGGCAPMDLDMTDGSRVVRRDDRDGRPGQPDQAPADQRHDGDQQLGGDQRQHPGRDDRRVLGAGRQRLAERREHDRDGGGVGEQRGDRDRRQGRARPRHRGRQRGRASRGAGMRGRE